MAPKRSTDGWPIVTHTSIGPIRFGMTRAEVAKAIGGKPQPFKKAQDPQAPTNDTFKVGGSTVNVTYTAEERCDFVQVTGEGLGGPELDGRGFLNRPYDRALAWIRERDPNVAVDAAGLRSNVLGLLLRTNADKIEAVAAFAADYR